MSGLLRLVQRRGTGRGDWAGLQPAQAHPRCTNVTAHPSTASVAITILLYDGQLLCGFNVAITGLMLRLDASCRQTDRPRLAAVCPTSTLWR